MLLQTSSKLYIAQILHKLDFFVKIIGVHIIALFRQDTNYIKNENIQIIFTSVNVCLNSCFPVLLNSETTDTGGCKYTITLWTYKRQNNVCKLSLFRILLSMSVIFSLDLIS